MRYRILRLENDGQHKWLGSDGDYIHNATLAHRYQSPEDAFEMADCLWYKDSKGVFGYFVERI